MANWSNPTITSNYVTFVDEVKARDVDAITLQAQPITSPPVNAVKMIRSGSLIRFQEWNGSAFQDLTLAVAGGGTGLTALAGLGGAMGLGTMAYQNATAVAISGGTVNNVSISSPTIHNPVINTPTVNGIMTHNGTYQLNGPMITQGLSSQWAVQIRGHGPDGTGGGGLMITAGSNPNDYGLIVYNHNASLAGFVVYANMGVEIRQGLIIPSGYNKWFPV